MGYTNFTGPVQSDNGFDGNVLTLPTQLAALGISQNFLYKSGSLDKWARAKARVTSRTGRGRLLCVGTSKTAGAGAGTGAQLMDGASPKAWPDLVAGLLTGANIPASRDSWMGSKGMLTPALVESYYGRLTMATKTNWGSAVTPSLGGSILSNSVDTTKLVFAPTAQTDTYVPFRVRSSGSGNLAYGVNGGAAISTPNANGTPSAIVQDTAVTAALGQNTWESWRTSGAGSFLGGIAYNSAVSAIDVINAGYFGSTTTDNVGGTFRSDAVIPVVAPDLTIIGLQTNDIANGLSVTTFTANMQTLITAAKSVGDCLLLVESFTALGGNVTLARQVAFRDATYALAATNNCSVLDFSTLMVSYVAANALGYFADTIHENALGYGREANCAVQPLVAA